MRRISMRRLPVVLATSLGILGIAGGGQIAGANPPTFTPQSLCEHQHGTFTSDLVSYTCSKPKGFNQHEAAVAEKLCAGALGFFEFSTAVPQRYSCILGRVP